RGALRLRRRPGRALRQVGAEHDVERGWHAVTEILELIDNALDDALSLDAMRWTPDPYVPVGSALGWRDAVVVDETYVQAVADLAAAMSVTLADAHASLHALIRAYEAPLRPVSVRGSARRRRRPPR